MGGNKGGVTLRKAPARPVHVDSDGEIEPTDEEKLRKVEKLAALKRVADDLLHRPLADYFCAHRSYLGRPAPKQ